MISRSGNELRNACHKLIDIHAQLKKSIKVLEAIETKEEVEEKNEIEKAEGEGTGAGRGDEKVKLRRKGNKKGKAEARKNSKSEGDRSSKESVPEIGASPKGGKKAEKKGKGEKKTSEEKKRASSEAIPDILCVAEEKKQPEEVVDEAKGKEEEAQGGGGGEGDVVVTVEPKDPKDEVVSGNGEDELKKAKIVFQVIDPVGDTGEEGREVTLDKAESSEHIDDTKTEETSVEEENKEECAKEVEDEKVESQTHDADVEDVDPDLSALIEAIEEIEQIGEDALHPKPVEVLPLQLDTNQETKDDSASSAAEANPSTSQTETDNVVLLPDMDSGIVAETPDSQETDTIESFGDSVALDIQVTPAEEDGKEFPASQASPVKMPISKSDGDLEKVSLRMEEDIWQRDPNSRPASGESLCTEL